MVIEISVCTSLFNWRTLQGILNKQRFSMERLTPVYAWFATMVCVFSILGSHINSIVISTGYILVRMSSRKVLRPVTKQLRWFEVIVYALLIKLLMIVCFVLGYCWRNSGSQFASFSRMASLPLLQWRYSATPHCHLSPGVCCVCVCVRACMLYDIEFLRTRT